MTSCLLLWIGRRILPGHIGPRQKQDGLCRGQTQAPLCEPKTCWWPFLLGKGAEVHGKSPGLGSSTTRCITPKFMPTRNVTLFGNRVFADVIILNLGCALNPMAGVLIRGDFRLLNAERIDSCCFEPTGFVVLCCGSHRGRIRGVKTDTSR